MDIDSNWGPKPTWHEENGQWFIMNDYDFPIYMSTMNVINNQYKLNVRIR